MILKRIQLLVIAGVVFLGANVAEANAQTIVDVAAGDPGTFSSLVDAVVAQDLVDTLNSDGPFTVFAPTNDAFADLPPFIGDALANDPALLTDILLYHVVADDLSSAEVLSKRGIKTVLGERVRVNQVGGDAFVNSSELIALDIDASNGTVHVIDRVLIPNKVYKAAIVQLREEIQELRAQIKSIREQIKDTRNNILEVRNERRSERFVNGTFVH